MSSSFICCFHKQLSNLDLGISGDGKLTHSWGCSLHYGSALPIETNKILYKFYPFIFILSSVLIQGNLISFQQQ